MIKIGCLLDKKDGVIASRFQDTGYICVIDAENYQLLKEFPRGGMSDEELARWVLEEDCEAIITGLMEQVPFEIVPEEGMITRYNGAGRTALEAIEQMNSYRLKIIPDFEGGTGCHSGEGCHEHEH